MLAAKFGATLQQNAERRRLAGSSPTLSSPTPSAPPSPPQSPPADGSSPPPSPPTADEASPGGRPSGRSARFSLSRQLSRNSNSARTSSSSEPEASPGGTTPGGTPGDAPAGSRRPGGLTRQATVGRLSAKAHKAAHSVSHAAHNVSHAAHEAGHSVSHAAHNVSHAAHNVSHAAHEAGHNVSHMHVGGSVRARLSRQKTSAALDENSPKSSRRAMPGANLLHKEKKLTQAEASTKLAEAMKCIITVNEGGELHRAAVKAGTASADGAHSITVTLESPSRHLQRVIDALLVAIAAAKKAGVEAAEQEAARLWLKQLQEAEAKAAGVMRLSLKGRGVLRIRLLKGEDLKATEDTTKDGEKDASDPYCELTLGEEEEKSSTIRGSLDPEWDELFEFRGKAAAPASAKKGQPTMAGQRPTMRDLISTPLKLELFDENRLAGLNFLARNKNIGNATVDLSPLLSSHEVPLRVPLSTQGYLSIIASWEVEEAYNPLEDELRGNGVLRVHLHSGASLKAVDTTGDGKADNADPYCKLAIADWKQQSATLDQTLDPKWDERFEFRGLDVIYGGRWSLSDLLSTPLELAIHDEDRLNVFFGDNKELGNATVDLSPLRMAREMTVTVPLHTQGDVTLTLAWEVEEPYVEGDAEAFALEAKDVVLWEAVASIRARLQALGFEADKERVASMIVGRDFVRRRYAIGGARPSPSSYH